MVNNFTKMTSEQKMETVLQNMKWKGNIDKKNLRA